MPGLLPNVRSELELGGVAIDRFTSPFGCGLGISYLKDDDNKDSRDKREYYEKVVERFYLYSD